MQSVIFGNYEHRLISVQMPGVGNLHLYEVSTITGSKPLSGRVSSSSRDLLEQCTILSDISPTGFNDISISKLKELPKQGIVMLCYFSMRLYVSITFRPSGREPK